jgi:hypothetical protein
MTEVNIWKMEKNKLKILTLKKLVVRSQLEAVT